MKKLIPLLAIAGAFSIQSALAQVNTHPTADTATINFVSRAANGGIMEVMTGKLAAAKAQRADVKAFGRRMVRDHSKANQKLQALARAKTIQILNGPLSPDDMLKNASGAEFDRQYVQMMVKDHEKNVAMFARAANSLPNKDVKMFAAQTLPTLRAHLQQIKAIAAKMKMSKR
jgi:putative membrane protein